ncbi:MAG: preprotein translocase subunit SecA [Patescibacteria group bacterium]
MSILTKIFGDPNARVLAKLAPLVHEINAREAECKKLSDDALRGKTAEFRRRLNEGEALDDLIPEAFAAVREAARRTLGQRHFDVQLLGGIVLHRGMIAEMKTGEGKTLTATLAVYLNALPARGVHVVTVNDYLAKRDVVWMGQIYHALGLTVGCIQHESAFVYDPHYGAVRSQKSEVREASGIHEGLTADKERDTIGAFKVEAEFLRPVPRKEAYAADITYGTNNEFGFDYLRNNMATRLDDMLQRQLHYAIVDEVDSILIDEARTPLIISAPSEEATEMYYRFAELVSRLTENEDYNVDEKMRASTLTEGGITKMEKWLGVPNLYAEGGLTLVHHMEQALRAHALFRRDRDYVVREGEVVIVDEFTGRLMFGRRYSEGLHQAIEAREKVPIQRESQTLATITFQNYFRLYEKLSGMTGTAATEAEEFAKIYKLEVVAIPTAKPLVRDDHGDRIYATETAKYRAVVAEVKERHSRGQPVLVGTISIEKNEVLSRMLELEGVPHTVLNAKNHEKEGEIIAQAGRSGGVTVATNMAGRGVDIILGGNPEDPEQRRRVVESGGLAVIGTERHESRRIDNQLRGRSGRQGDAGETRFYVSLEDDLMRIFGGSRVKAIMERFGLSEDTPIEHGMVSRSLAAAQRKVEGHNFDIRKHLLDYDDVLNRHREAIYKRRREILDLGETDPAALREKILEMVEHELEQMVLFHTASEAEAEWNLEEIFEAAGTIFPLPPDARGKLADFRHTAGSKLQDATARTTIIEYVMELARAAYAETEKRVNAAASGASPESLREGSFDAMRQVERGIMLRAIDTLWIEHLDAIDHLRAGIGLRGFGQRDPLVEYQHEAYRMFRELLQLIEKQAVYSIYKVGFAAAIAPSLLSRRGIQVVAPAKTMEKGEIPAAAGGIAPQKVAATSVTAAATPKVGRNDSCPCGSGQKYKRCHGQ